MKSFKKFFLAIITIILIFMSFSNFSHGDNTKKEGKNDTVKIYVDGKELSFDLQPEIVNNDTAIPIRKLVESLNIPVHYDEANKTVYVGTEKIISSSIQLSTLSKDELISILEVLTCNFLSKEELNNNIANILSKDAKDKKENSNTSKENDKLLFFNSKAESNKNIALKASALEDAHLIVSNFEKTNKVNYNERAFRRSELIISTSYGFSRTSLKEVLKFAMFKDSEIDYAVNRIERENKINYNIEAVKSALFYLDHNDFNVFGDFKNNESEKDSLKSVSKEVKDIINNDLAPSHSKESILDFLINRQGFSKANADYAINYLVKNKIVNFENNSIVQAEKEIANNKGNLTNDLLFNKLVDNYGYSESEAKKSINYLEQRGIKIESQNKLNKSKLAILEIVKLNDGSIALSKENLIKLTVDAFNLNPSIMRNAVNQLIIENKLSFKNEALKRCKYLISEKADNDFIIPTGYSKSGLYNTLKKEHFTEGEINYAINYIIQKKIVNFNEQAYKKALEYLNSSTGYSKYTLSEALLKESKFTTNEVNYAINKLNKTGYNFNEQALIKALELTTLNTKNNGEKLTFSSDSNIIGYSKEMLEKTLIKDFKFSKNEAKYAINTIDKFNLVDYKEQAILRLEHNNSNYRVPLDRIPKQLIKNDKFTEKEAVYAINSKMNSIDIK